MLLEVKIIMNMADHKRTEIIGILIQKDFSIFIKMFAWAYIRMVYTI
jgi:hypothetical protein